MKWFGGKAGREGARPALSRAGVASAIGWQGGGWLQGGGLAGYEAQVRDGYALRGGDVAAVMALLDAWLARGDGERPGDILLASPGPAQLHLAIRTAAGVVHADAGLRRIVERPGPPPWRVIGAWRPPAKED